jgi:tetratricopeptide (TPR) repeat protein
MTGLFGYAGPRPLPGRFALSKSQLEEFVHDVVKAIGMTGDERHKLGFAVGPLCFDMSDEETRQFIRDSLAVALENDVAVAFHLDDSMSWGHRKDLLANPDNIETADWKQVPSTGRRADWGRTPTKFPPQMCFNSPGIIAAVKARAGVIGAEIKHALVVLKSQRKEHLFAGIMAGWETQIGQDFDTNRPLGYRALSHRGFSEAHPPKDPDLEWVRVVKEFMELWTDSLHAAGIPRENICCHIAFTSQGLRPANAKESYAERVHFALPETAFSSAYRPGFSTYPEGGTFNEIYAALAKHGSPGWVSAEGANVSPAGMPGEPTMETYLARTFNHGGVMVNVFSWGIGGEAMRNNFFRRATESPECLAAYAKFLRGETLVESAATGFSAAGLQDKMHRIQKELPGWVQQSGQHTRAMPLMQKIQSLMKERKWQELDKVADELLALMKGDSPAAAKTEALSLMERLPSKIKKIQGELPAWIGSDAERRSKATSLMQQLQEHLKAKNFEEAEKTADSILKLMGADTQAAPQGRESKSQQTPSSSHPSDDPTKRLTEKVERVKEGARKWAASGRDPSAIAKAMEERFKPLIEAGKVVEAEAELDRVLEQLKQDEKSAESPTDSTKAVRQRIAGKVERLMTAKVHRVQQGAQQWAASGRDPSAIGKAMEEKFLPLMEGGKVIEAEAELDRLLEQLKSDGKSAESLNEPAEAMRQRKVGAHDSLAEKFQPLMEAGKFVEAEAELDRLLEQLKPDGKSTESPTAATKSDTATPRTPGTPDEEARAHFLHDLAGPFFVSRDKVQADLKLSDDQKHKLRETMTGYVQETMKVQQLSGAERKQAMNSLRQKSYKQLELFLKEILTPEQLKRFAELKLQYDMPMIMLQPDIVKELNITDEQRQQFMTLIQEMQKVVAPLIQASRSGGNPHEILAKVTKLRLDCQGKIEALLSDAQKTQWKEMTGTPLVIW